MSSKKPSLSKFQQQLESVFGQPLTSDARLVSEDFWRNWGEFHKGIFDGSICINVDILSLSRSFPEYGKYKIWGGLSIVCFFVGIIMIFFFWPVGVVLLLGGIGFKQLGKYIRISNGKKFVTGLKKEIIEISELEGMANLCAHYIAGNIQITSKNYSAHWPQFPSSTLNGGEKFIPM